MTHNDESDWITGQEAAALLRLSERSVQRYATGNEPRLRTRKYTGSKKLFYYRADVEDLADELEVAKRPAPIPAPRQPKQEMVPAGQMLDYLRQRDEELRAAQQQLTAVSYELGQARAELQRRQLVDEQLSQVSRERDEVQRQIRRLQLQRAALATAVVLLLAALVVFLVIVLRN